MIKDNVTNRLSNCAINGNFVGRDLNQYIQKKEKDLFNEKVFVHFVGEKISNFIFGEDHVKERILDNLKLLVFFFDKLFFALSDITQTDLFLSNPFYKDLFGHKNNCEYIVSVIGANSHKDLQDFLANREEYYHKPSFYSIPSHDSILGFLSNLECISQYKNFSTIDTISYDWDTNITNIISQENIFLKNIFVSNRKYFQSIQSEELLRISEKLNGYPFIWDSVTCLNLIKYDFNRMSVYNIELFLASEWIKAYLNNLNMVITSSLIGQKYDASFGLDRSFNFAYIIQFLEEFQLTQLLISLNFSELLELKFKYGMNLKMLINLMYNRQFHYNNISKIKEKILKIIEYRASNYCKAKEIIQVLEEAM